MSIGSVGTVLPANLGKNVRGKAVERGKAGKVTAHLGTAKTLAHIPVLGKLRKNPPIGPKANTASIGIRVHTHFMTQIPGFDRLFSGQSKPQAGQYVTNNSRSGRPEPRWHTFGVRAPIQTGWLPQTLRR
jgi:hypothetical protein